MIQNNSLLSFMGSTVRLADSVIFEGLGTVKLTSGTLTAQPTGDGADGVAFSENLLFAMEGGSFRGSGLVTIHGSMIWSGGTISNSSFNFSPSSYVFLTGEGDKDFISGAINNAGTVIWDNGRIRGYNNAVFNNLASGYFNINCGQTYLGYVSFNYGGVFNNYGLLRKSSTQDTTRFTDGTFNNFGDLQIESGALFINSGSITTGHSGVFTVDEGSTLAFTGNTNRLADSAVFGGFGTVRLTNGTLSVQPTGDGADGVVFTEDLTFEMLGGNFSGSGLVTHYGIVNWLGGQISNSNWTVNEQAEMSIIGPEVKYISGGNITNHGSIVWNGGNIYNYSGAAFSNHQAGLFSINCDATFFNNLSGHSSGSFHNHGTMVKTDDEGSTIISGGAFTNNGLITVGSGTLFINSSTFPNYSSNSLIGGQYHIHGTLKIHNATINNLHASVVLEGLESQIVNHNNENALANLSSISADGSLILRGGRDLSTTAAIFNNSGVLDCGTGILNIVNQEFYNNANASLLMGHIDGISLQNNVGNIQGPGVKVLSSEAHYVYNGFDYQVSGSALPAIVKSLTVDNPMGLTLTSNLLCTESLVLLRGEVATGNNSLTLGTNTNDTGVLTVAEGFINGSIKRWISQDMATELLFPLGLNSHKRSIALSYSTLPDFYGTITSSFFSLDPGSDGFPLVDDGVDLLYTLPSGYWSLSAGDGLSGGVYDIELSADGFNGFSNYESLHMVTRIDNQSSWDLSGNHILSFGSNQNPIISRTGLSGLFEYGIASAEEPPPVLSPPVVLLSVVNGTVNLCWDPVPGAFSYLIYALEDPFSSGPGVVLAQISSTSYSEEAFFSKTRVLQCHFLRC